ncbi:MAG: hypothetical protein CL489_10740 [Acidobacteria bacterium]|nr:hypothetical protein [Acidobacteriota bacterium]
MKNFHIITEKEDLDAMMDEIFLTDMFKDCIREEGNLLHDLWNILTDRPAIFYDPTYPEIERHHFTSWMGCVQRREYDNPYIHDLHILHEIFHHHSMKYTPDVSFAKWHEKMCFNEYLTATVSEAFIYYLLPDLREKTFDFEIWVDRFIEGNDKAFEDKYEILLSRYKTAKEGGEINFGEVLVLLQGERIKAMQTPNPWDFCQMQLHTFSEQNFNFSLVWKDNWRVVESHMKDMIEEYQAAETADDRAWVAMNHIEWLNEKSQLEGSTHNCIPFEKEAYQFYDKDQDIYIKGGNHLFKAAIPVTEDVYTNENLTEAQKALEKAGYQQVNDLMNRIEDE